MDERMGANINGPSLIRVPAWLPNPLGRYYLYFAHHAGTYIRLACADALEGPWRIHSPGTLRMDQTPFPAHIASPDVHVDSERREIRMYYHGAFERPPQHSCLATSRDGIHFESTADLLGPSYFRVFRYQSAHYAIAMPSRLYRSVDGLGGFEPGPMLLPGDERNDPEQPRTRHSAVLVAGETLHLFYSRKRDAPEHILRARINLAGDWRSWRFAGMPESVIRPEKEYEGARLPPVRSEAGAVHGPVHQLRDPALYREADRTYLLYSVAGERGIAIAEIEPSL